MNLIALIQPLILIKCLKIHLTLKVNNFCFFCATCVVQMYFLNTDLIFLFYFLFCCFN